MKGFTKAIMRTPHMMSTKVGMAKKSADPDFDEYNRHFTAMEGAVEQLLKDTKSFMDAVNSLLTSGHQYSVHFSNIFSPFSNEYNLDSKHPSAAATVRDADVYQREMEELRLALSPELELIDNRVINPAKDLQQVMKLIRKNITKRDHKLIDYDRFNSSLTKLREKQDKSLNDEKNLFKLEQDFEHASQEYDTYNDALKADLPAFMKLAVQFIDPLFHSFYYMQLNIYYLMLEKLNTFCEKKYDGSGTTQDIINTYEHKKGDAREKIEALDICKKYMSSSRLLAARSQGGASSPPSSLGAVSRSNTTASSASTANKFGSLAAKKGAPPPPPGAFDAAAAPPPPYSTGGTAAAATNSFAAAKKAPPPPPPVKPKPAATKSIEYCTALYNFDAQAEGDLSFKAGDKVEIIQKSDNAEDWWTGRLNGQEGVFPGNYVQL